MFWLNLLKNIVSILQSEISPRQIAAGFAMGSIIGLTPFNTLHSYVILFLVFMLNVNIASATLAALVFGIIGMFIDPVSNKVGYSLLVSRDSLTPMWTYLYNLPIVPFTRFNNTVVLGSFVIALILLIPVYFAMLWFVGYYRAHFKDKVQKWKIMKLFNITKVGNIYDNINQ